MSAAFRSEWIKLRRPRFLWGTLGAISAVAVLGTTLTILRVGRRDRGETISIAQLAQPDGLVQGLERASTLLGVVTLAVVAAAVTMEYSQGTLRNLLVAEPRRLRLLGGKYGALLTFIAVVVVAATAAGVATSFLLAPSKGIPTGAWTSRQGLTALGKGFTNVLLSAIGYGSLGVVFALVLRSPAAAISVGLAYALPVEALLSRVWSPASRWLPGQLLDTIASGGGESTVSYLVAGLRLVSYAVIAAAAVSALFHRQDVTA